MTKTEFMKELFTQGNLTKIVSSRRRDNIYICSYKDCDNCDLCEACDVIFNGCLPDATKEELEEFLNSYPEARIVL